MADEVIPEKVAAHLCARLARMLLAYGADADYTLKRVAAAAGAVGAELHIQLAEGAVLVTTGDVTRVGRPLANMGADMGRLIAIDTAVSEVARRPQAAAALDHVLDNIEAQPARYGGFAVALSVGVTAASLARLFGAAWPVVAVTLLAGVLGTVIRRWLTAKGANAIMAIFIVALISGASAGAAMRALPGQSPVLALAAAGMVLVPGVPLINGVRDLVGGHAALAITRLTLATVTILTIASALFLSAAAFGDVLPVQQGPGRLPVLEDVLFSAAAVIGYAALFDLPLAALPLAVVCGIASHASRTALADQGVNLAAGSLVGALLAGIVARLAGRLHRIPAVTFAFPGTVAMIPGSFGFRAGVGGLHIMALGAAAPLALLAQTASLAVTTAVTTIAIGIGLSLAFAVPIPTLERVRGKEADHQHAT